MRRLLSLGLALAGAAAGFAAGVSWRGAEPLETAWGALFGDEDGALVFPKDGPRPD